MSPEWAVGFPAIPDFSLPPGQLVVAAVQVLLEGLEGLLHLRALPLVRAELPPLVVGLLLLRVARGLRPLELVHLRLDGAPDVGRGDPLRSGLVGHAGTPLGSEGGSPVILYITNAAARITRENARGRSRTGGGAPRLSTRGRPTNART